MAWTAHPEIVAAAIPDAQIRILEGQAHMGHLADPRAFAAQVLSFLGD